MAELMDSGELKTRALELGFQSVGVAPAVRPPHLAAYREWLGKGYDGTMAYLADQLPLKEHPDRLLPGVQSIIAVTLNYYQPAAWSEGQPKIARYALGRDYHKVLRGKLRKLALWIEAEFPNAACRPCVDSAPIMERDFANLAGLGFFGKNTMLIDPKRGSWFFIGLLLTTVPLKTDELFHGGCGTCTKCVDACPTGALVYESDRWQLDARRCISYLTIEHSGDIEAKLAESVGEWTFGCDVCQEVCPFNQPRESQPDRAMLTTEADFLGRKWPQLQDLATMDTDSWEELTKGSPVRRAGHQGLKRNAAINLKNRGR